MTVITDEDALLLLINTYMIKRIDSANAEVDQEKFIECVQKIFSENNLSYSRKQILTTWKQLLESYYHFKENLSSEQTSEAWSIFSVMDNCFDESTSTSEKFSDPNMTMHLIEYMSEYKEIILNHGLNMTVLRNVENKFQHLKNNTINQKDIYVQWNNLEMCFEDREKQIQPQNFHHRFIEAMKFYIYNTDSQNYYSSKISKRPMGKNECVTKRKFKKRLNKYMQKEVNNLHTISSETMSSSFSRIGNKEQINTKRNEYEGTSKSTLAVLGEYSKHTSESSADINHCEPLENKETGSVRKEENTLIKGNGGVNGILNKYENRYKELAELKEVVIENNLLKKEYKYLLNLFSDKMKTKRL